jgi:uncharacterized protein (TIGR02285 family)
MIKLSLSICLNVALVCLLASPSKAWAEDLVRWVKLDFAPFEINTPPDAGLGVIDQFKTELQKIMPQYHYRHSGVVNQDRLMLRFEQETICHGALIKTPQIEKVTYMSIGIGLMPTHAIITPAHNKHAFAQQKSTSLRLLLENLSLVAAVPSRTFGPVIDSITASYSEQSNLYFRQAVDMHGLFEMLFKQRFDYTVGYPAEAMYWNRQNPDKPLAIIGIEELAEKYVIGRVACSKTELGRKIINDVNKSLEKHRFSENYISTVFLPWLPEDLHSEYVKDFHKIISNDSWTNVD